MGIAPKAGTAELRFKRRLISRGRRLHLFVFGTADGSVSESYGVTYRAERGGAVTRFEASPTLPEWTTASMMAVVHAILDGLLTADRDADTRLLARFLSMKSSWSAPCRYAGTDAGVSLGVFDVLPKAFEPITAFTVAAGSVTAQRLVPLAHDEHSCCLVGWGEPFDQAYLEVDGELVELRFAAVRGSALRSVVNWFAELTPRQQDAVLDGISAALPQEARTRLERFGRYLSPSRDFGIGSMRGAALAAFAIGSTLYILVDAPRDGVPTVHLSTASGEDQAVEAQSWSPSEADPRRRVLYRADTRHELSDGSPIRLRVGPEEVAASFWLPLQGLESSHARRRICNLIDWARADEDLVSAFAIAAVSADAQTKAAPPAVIMLSQGDPRPDAALVVCRYGGDVFGLKATLLALRLTAGDEVTIRLVCRGQPSLSETLALRAVVEGLGLPCGMVALDRDAPFTDALKSGRDDRRRGLILIDSGIVPLDRDWWQRLAVLFDSTVLYYGLPEPSSAVQPSALTYLSGASPLLAAGPRLAAEILDQSIDLQTFEGTLHHAISSADRTGRAERVGWLRLMSVADPSMKTTSLGAARLDDAVIRAALASLMPGDMRNDDNLVRLGAARAGNG